MRDVARLAGVSVQTVSCVVNGKPGITEETRTRVREAVDQLGYRPYSVARSLRTRQTRTIALVVSDIANPSFATMASAAEDHANKFGYSVILHNTHDDVEREARYIRSATERWVDGVLFVSAKDHMKSLDTLHVAGIPSVAIDRIPGGYVGASVTLDNLQAGRVAAEHLLSLGHTCLGHISGPIGLRLCRERRQGFLAALQASGLVVDPRADAEGNWACQSGYEAMQRMLRDGPQLTAIFAANDRMAMGAMRAIYEAGLNVPADISVIGLDDIEMAAYQSPPLTTVRQSFEQLATLGVQLLLDILAGKEAQKRHIVLEPVLVVRQSTTCVKGV